MSVPIIVIDYGAGNIRSVERALVHVGADVTITDDPAAIAEAPGLVLPGVGAAADTMANLRSRELVEPIRNYIESGRPFLGVCMGMQALLEWSEEGGRQECLGIAPGHVVHFPVETQGLKIPHMGWNTVRWTAGHPVTDGIPSGSYFYFVHSFHAVVEDPSWVLGETAYGVTFPSVLGRDNVVATQFHPEKSGERGLQLYRNFVSWVARESSEAARAAGSAS